MRFIWLHVEICVCAIKPRANNLLPVIDFLTALDSRPSLSPQPIVFLAVPTEGTLAPKKYPPPPIFQAIIQTRMRSLGYEKAQRIKRQNHYRFIHLLMHSDSLLRIYLCIKAVQPQTPNAASDLEIKPDGISEAAMSTALNVGWYLLRRLLLLSLTVITMPPFIPLFLSSLHSPLKVNYF